MTPPIMNILAASMLATATASAAVYTGTLTSGSGLTGFEDWQTGASLSWTVSDQVDGCDGWNYSYVFSVPHKDISHAIIEVSDVFADINILDSTGGIFTLDNFSATTQGASNPGMPEPMRGIKIDVIGDTTTLEWSFCSDINPVWGDFYSKDGKTGGEEVYLFNSGFTAADPTTPVDPNDPEYIIVTDHIIVPDSVGGDDEGPGPLPEPSTSMLSALGLILLLRRRTK